jgi:hypothetical protein
MMQLALTRGVDDVQTRAASDEFFEGNAVAHYNCWNEPLWQFSTESKIQVKIDPGQWPDLHFLRNSGTQVPFTLSFPGFIIARIDL